MHGPIYSNLVLRPVDIPVLLKLTLTGMSGLSFQKLAACLHLSSSEVYSSFKRSRLSGFLAPDEPKKVNRSALLEFLEHGLRYSFPAERGNPTRGIPTAYAAEPLKAAVQQGEDLPPVWPCVKGKVRGYAFTPLYNHAAAAAMDDAEFYQLLTLVDALRDGRVRERKLAMDELRVRLAPVAQ
jgi:hypothetical protein